MNSDEEDQCVRNRGRRAEDGISKDCAIPQESKSKF